MPQGKLILLTGNVGMFDPDAAEAAMCDSVEEYVTLVVKKWNSVTMGVMTDIYVLGGLFGDLPTPELRERAEQILRKLPGRKYLITETAEHPEATMAGWYTVLPSIKLRLELTDIYLEGEYQNTVKDPNALYVHGYDGIPDTAHRVSCGWGRWGELFGLVNLHYLVSYAKNIGAGYIEG